MSFRTVVITQNCKCSYKNGYMIVRSVDVTMIHLSEIHTLLFDTTAVSLTSYLVCELLNNKINVIFCDEKHNPLGEVIPFYGSYNTSKKIMNQIVWNQQSKQMVWTSIVARKIHNQYALLKEFSKPNKEKLLTYIEQLEFNDASNREGHAAKVYFNAMFGKDFSRNNDSYLNAALDYGYSILLSVFNREVVTNGYITQLGICHKNEFNQFNLSCDLMEPFRFVIDKFVYSKHPFVFSRELRFELVDLLNCTVLQGNTKTYLNNAIKEYTRSVFSAIEKGDSSIIKFIQTDIL